MDIVALLYEQAREITNEGHAGWGNTMFLAAEEIEKLRASQHRVEPTLDTSPVFVPKPCPVCGQTVCNH